MCYQTGIEHPCQACGGNPTTDCEHLVIGKHQYCNHTEDDKDHEWHYTRTE